MRKQCKKLPLHLAETVAHSEDGKLHTGMLITWELLVSFSPQKACKALWGAGHIPADTNGRSTLPKAGTEER